MKVTVFLTGLPFCNTNYIPLKKDNSALARWLSWLEHCPIYQKVVGLIPSQGKYERQPIDLSLSLSLSVPLSHPSFSLKSINISWMRIKKVKKKKKNHNLKTVLFRASRV